MMCVFNAFSKIGWTTRVSVSIRKESQVRKKQPPKHDNLNVARQKFFNKSENTYYLEIL